MPVGAHGGCAGRCPHPPAAHRHRGVVGPVLPSAAARRGGGAARPAIRRAGQLGRGPRFCPGRVRGLWRAADGEYQPVSRNRRDRPQGMDQRAAEFCGRAFPLCRCRGLAQTGAAPAPAGVAGGELRGGDRVGRRARLFDPDGPAFLGRRDRPQAPLLCRAAGRGGVFGRRPRHSGGAAGGARPHRGGGRGGRRQRCPMDRPILSRRPAPPGLAAEFHSRGCRPGPAVTSTR